MNPAAFGYLQEGQAEKVSEKVCEWTQDEKSRELSRVRYELQKSKNREWHLRQRNDALNRALGDVRETLAAEYAAKLKDAENENRKLKEALGREKGKATKAQRGRDAARNANKVASREIGKLCREIKQLRFKVANLEAGM